MHNLHGSDCTAKRDTTIKMTGRKILNKININEVIPFIDWKMFFHSWKLSAKYHTVLYAECRSKWLASFPENEQERTQEALKLYDDAWEMLRKFKELDVEYIKAVFGIYEANSENDTIYIDEKPFPFLRQQTKNEKDEYLCLSDFIAPISSRKKDFIGVFAVTAASGADYLLSKYEKEGDEYSVLLIKSLLDRLAEAATEWLHLSTHFQGIRPAVGYPSIPDQSINFPLHELLKSEEIGISLTENGIMSPNASVSGFFFPRGKYFAVGEISEEQLEDYAGRKGTRVEDVRKFLAGNLINE